MTKESPQYTFLLESRELLDEMETSLLALENEPDNSELINAVFRAIHTIKGTGGVFGFDSIVEFTHIAESVLDKVRDGEIALDSDLTADMLKTKDCLEVLVEAAVDESVKVDPALQAQADQLAQRFSEIIAQEASEAGEQTDQNAPENQAPETASSESGKKSPSDFWHISLRFGPDSLRNGFDPASIVHFLKQTGEIVDLTTLVNRIPKPADMDPESCYLGFEVSLRTEAERSEIDSAFEFVQDDCDIVIIPPNSVISRYIDLINNAPDEAELLGEILIKSGVLTADDIQDALNSQAQNELSNEDSNSAARKRLGEVLVEENKVEQVVVDAALDRQKQVRSMKTERKYLRIDASKLDSLINLVGELVIAGAGTSLLVKNTGDSRLIESTSLMSRLVEEIRDSSLRLRMVEIGETFNRFNRVVRDLSNELGKDIRLEIEGKETELDKTVVEKVGDPLMHLVRNAIDHGIEMPEDRTSAGKPAQGTLKLNAYHDSGNIVIEVSDDGKGLDKEKILTKALEKNIITHEQTLSDHDIYRLIFHPGFSTAAAVTNISGRGVGMDVVKQNIEALRGTVDVTSEPGKGSTISIRLPLTLAIIDGFLVSVGKVSYVVPLDMVVECLEFTDLEEQGLIQHNYLNMRGEVVPFVRLRSLFGEEQTSQDVHENIIIVRSGNLKAGLIVDELLGEFQTVIKPLGRLFKNLRSISGSTILGSGEVAMILDIAGLVEQITALYGNVNEQKAAAAAPALSH